MASSATKRYSSRGTPCLDQLKTSSMAGKLVRRSHPIGRA